MRYECTEMRSDQKRAFQLCVSSRLISFLQMLHRPQFLYSHSGPIGVYFQCVEVTVTGPSGKKRGADPALGQNPVELKVGELLVCSLRVVFGCVFEEAKERLYFQVFVDLSDIDSEGQFLGTVLGFSLNSQQTEKDVAPQIAIGFSLGCADGMGIFFDLEADDLRIGVLFPGGLVAEDCLFQFGDVVVEELCEIGHFLEEGHRDAFAAVVQDHQCLRLLDLLEV